jgi:Glycosyl transferase 4-like domain
LAFDTDVVQRTARGALRTPSCGRGASQARRVLFVSYAFPPAGGVSVQRVTKFIKYLPSFGWSSSVLTVANPSVPMFDHSMSDEIPADTLVRRARTFEPSYATKSIVAASTAGETRGALSRVKGATKDIARKLSNLALQPDSQILWRPHALREGTKLLQEVPHDLIFATGPPFSSFLLGRTLAKRAKLPLILDYRDEWNFTTYWENKRTGRLESFVQARMQRSVLRAADMLLATTAATADELKRNVAAAGGSADVAYIYNGFDPPDYPTVDDSQQPRVDYGHGVDLFRMAFVGTLWNLTPISPLVEAIKALTSRSPELVARIELVVAGRRTAQQESILDALATTPIKLVRLPFVSHKEAIKLMCDSDALLLINADLPTTHRLVNAKTFEYMAARRPIFVIAPQGELWTLLRDLPGTILTEPGEPLRIADGLAVAIQRWQRRGGFERKDWDVSRFERRHLAGELAGILDGLAAGRRGAGTR